MEQEVVPSLPTCEVIILTALPVEFQAVVEHLWDTQEIVHPQGTIYRVGNFTGKKRLLHVAVAQIGMGGGSAALETERAIHFFRPHLLLFVGIAGGLKDVRLGDVVVATKVYAYEVGKAGQTFEPRPELWRPSYSLWQRALHEASGEAWLARLNRPLSDAPRVLIGALAAGEKVVASTQSAVYTQLKVTYGDTLAVEMEGHGFLQAMHVNHNLHGLVIRGISDLIDSKAATDAAGMQTIAARHAAAFAFQVLAKSTFSPPINTSSPSTISSTPIPLPPTNRNPLIKKSWLRVIIVTFIVLLSSVGGTIIATRWHPNSTLSVTATASDTAIAACAATPSLTGPVDGQTLNSRTVILTWEAPPDCLPEGYTVRISTEYDTEAQPWIIDTGWRPTYYPHTFSADGTYYWHIRACKPCTPFHPGHWAIRSFTIHTSSTT